MNKHQRLVITVAIIDLIVVLLFPPFVERTLARHALTSFDGFYFLPFEFGHRSIDAALLNLELLWIAINALSAWLLLGQNFAASQRESLHRFGIGAFAIVNLAIVGLFPPFEQYNSLLRTTAPGFDSFYFIFGDRSARPLFQPLLQLEIFFVLINALALVLLFNAVERSATADAEGHTADAPPVHKPPESAEPNQLAAQREAELMTTLGRKTDRRHHEDPSYRGVERRSGHERRHLA
jgi:hypothetical protein